MEHPSDRVARLLPRPLYKASIKVLAQGAQGPVNTDASEGLNILIERIRKCLSRGEHQTTSPSEAEAALWLASKLMAKHGLTRADIIPTDPDPRYCAGQSDVWIRHFDGIHTGQGQQPRLVRDEAFVSDLATAVETFFDCKHYSYQGASSMTWVFYGIAENTVVAACAFESAYNSIAGWMRSQSGSSAKSSYSRGVAAALKERADRERLEAAGAEHFARNTHDSNPAYQWNTPAGYTRDSESTFMPTFSSQADWQGSSNLDCTGTDFNDEMDFEGLSFLNMDKDVDELLEKQWSSRDQLVVFLQNAEKIAADYLAGRDVKLRNRSRRPPPISNQAAYELGRMDAGYIDVKRRAIMEG